MKSSILGVVVSIALAGCGTVSPQPTGPDVAYLKFAGDSMHYELINIYKNLDDCSGGTVAIPKDQNPFLAGAKPLVIEGGKDVSFFLTTISGMTSCQIYMTFHTTSGHTYIANSANQKRTCTIEIFDATASSGGAAPQREPTQRQRQKAVPLLQDGSFCK